MGDAWSGRKSQGGSNTDNAKSIDIRYLKQKTDLVPGYTGSLSWSRAGRATGSIGYRIESDAIHLSYQNQQRGKSPQQMNYAIKFDKTPCNYGGERTWLLCPYCEKRVAVIYSYDAYFLCRKCCSLPYASQAETKADRMRRKARKIRERLGASNNLFEPVTVKPKGMHERTFDRLQREEIAANMASLQCLPKSLMASLGLK